MLTFLEFYNAGRAPIIYIATVSFLNWSDMVPKDQAAHSLDMVRAFLYNKSFSG